MARTIQAKAAYLLSLPLESMTTEAALAAAAAAGFETARQDIYIARHRRRSAPPRAQPASAPPPPRAQPASAPPPPTRAQPSSADIERELRRLVLRVGVERARDVVAAVAAAAEAFE